MNLFKLLGIGTETEPASAELGQLFEILSDLLSDREEEDVKWITAVAGLLGTVANANAAIGDDELDHIGTVLRGELGLELDNTGKVLELLAKHRVRLFAIEDFVYLRLVNDLATRQQKKDLLRLLFGVGAADGSITGDEEAVIRRISNGLNLAHRDYIEARREFKERLSVFQQPS